MRISWAIVLIFGFFSFANGYFKAPGMEKLDNLFRGGPSSLDNWDDMLKTDNTFENQYSFKNQHSFRIPQIHSFYHKLEAPHRHNYDPFNHHFFSHRSSTRLSMPSGYSNDMLQMKELTRLVSKTNGGEQRVVGGRDVAEGEIPWQVSLQRKSMKSGKIFHICGGSIIDKEWVVTAAHCVALALLSNYRVVSATTNLRDENRIKGFHSHDYSIHKAVDVHIHDDYDMFRFRNDIALIRVEPPFEFSHKVQAIALPSSGHQAHGMAYASGWGLTQEGVRVTPSKLQAVSLPIVSDSECRQAYGDNLAESMICAGYRQGGKSVCQGDSGGPLFQKHGGETVLIGVVSWGVGCARPGKPGVYTEVSHYISWIQDITSGGFGERNIVH